MGWGGGSLLVENDGSDLNVRCCRRRACGLGRRRSMEKETLMTNMAMSLPEDFYDSDTEVRNTF